MKVTIGGTVFKSKTELLARIRYILYFYKMGSEVTGDDSRFLSASLSIANQYYNYPKETPIAWRVQCQAMGRHPEFVFIRPDGTQENPSVKRLAMVKPRKGKSAKSAARREIMPFIDAFRQNRLSAHGCYHCDECSYESNQANEFEVDHKEPEFAEIWQRWLETIGLHEDEIEIVEHYTSKGVMRDYGFNEVLSLSFRTLHNGICQLQLLCRGCHVHKTYGHDYEERAA